MFATLSYDLFLTKLSVKYLIIRFSELMLKLVSIIIYNKRSIYIESFLCFMYFMKWQMPHASWRIWRLEAGSVAVDVLNFIVVGLP